MPNSDILPAQANALISRVQSNSPLYFLTDWPFPSASRPMLDKDWESLKDGQVVKQLRRVLRKIDMSLSLLGREANSDFPLGRECPTPTTV